MSDRYSAECDYCDSEIEPANKAAIGHICDSCIVDIQVGEKVDESELAEAYREMYDDAQ